MAEMNLSHLSQWGIANSDKLTHRPTHTPAISCAYSYFGVRTAHNYDISVHRDSIMRLSARVGHGCARLHDRLMRDLQVN